MEKNKKYDLTIITVILSGILHEQARTVTRRFGTEDFVLLRRKREKEWVTLLLKRK